MSPKCSEWDKFINTFLPRNLQACSTLNYSFEIVYIGNDIFVNSENIEFRLRCQAITSYA